jgi:transposase
LCVYLQNYQLLPLERTSQLLTDLLGCRISQATLRKMAEECAAGLAETEAEIKAQLRHSAVLHADETSVRVNKAGHYVHVASTEFLTHYGYHQQRGQAAMEEIGILPQYTGHVVHDGWWSYWQYRSCRHSLCVAHLLRELIYIEESHPHQRGVWAEPMAKLLLEIKQAVDEARRAGEGRLSEEQIRDYDQRYHEIIEQAVELNPERLASTKEAAGKRGKLGKVRQTEARNLVSRLERHKSEVLKFMTDFCVPFDNNQAERDLRMLKLQQKTSGCFRTTEGARRFCRTRGVISTWRKQGRELFASLEKVFQEPKQLETLFTS